MVWETEIGHRGGTLHEDSASHFIFMNISNCSANKGYLPLFEHNKSGLSTEDGEPDVSTWNCFFNRTSPCFQKEHFIAIIDCREREFSENFLLRRCSNTGSTVTLLSSAIAPIQLNNTLPFLFFKMDSQRQFFKRQVIGKGLLDFSQSFNS